MSTPLFPTTLRLALATLAARRLRTALLVAAVALSAALIAAVACAMASVSAAINHQLATTVGAADVRLKPAAAGAPLDAALLQRVQAWPEVQDAAGILEATLAVTYRTPVLMPRKVSGIDTWERRDEAIASTVVVTSINPGSTPRTGLNPPPDLVTGRLPTADNEIVIDALLATRLSAARLAERNSAIASGSRDGFVLPTTLDPAVLADPTPAPTSIPPTTLSEAEATAINAQLRIRPGDRIDAVRQLIRQIDSPLAGLSNLFRESAPLTVVGISKQPPLGGRPRAFMTLEGVRAVSGQRTLTQIDILTNPTTTPQALVDARKAEIPKGILLQTTEKITSGLDRNVASSRLGLVLAMVMGAIAGGFIILTGLMTAVAERQRELAILRCIGGTRQQLARTQLYTGLTLGVLGALIGVPLGIAVAALIARAFATQLPVGLVIEPWGLVIAALCAIFAGILGAIYPAYAASRVSPLTALKPAARTTTARRILLVGAIGLVGLAIQALLVTIPTSGQVVFWAYATLGLPLMYAGYFLIGIPAIVGVSWLVSPLLSRVLRLPPRILHRTIAATPARHGLTAGALMGGLALMVTLWTNGGAILRDWIGKIQFPDAFVSGVNLDESVITRISAMTDIVADASAVTLHPVETDVFGVRALQQYKTTFVGFDPEPFFRMTRLTWIQGDEATATKRLNQGGAVIVAREFLTARGLGVGHRFTASQDGQTFDFEIVGVVASPGLEIVSRFFNVGEDMTDQSLHAIFGSRQDLKAKFFQGNPAPVQMVQIAFTPEAAKDDGLALDRIRTELIGTGILDAGSGRQIKILILTFAKAALLAMSTIAAVAMLIACAGVANIIVASVESRRFEFGVLRAVGGTRNLLTRLVLAEALIIALTAGVLGTLLGAQGAYAGRRLHAMLLGLNYDFHIPTLPVALGWLVLIAFTLAAALPAILRVTLKRPRELLAAMKG